MNSEQVIKVEDPVQVTQIKYEPQEMKNEIKIEYNNFLENVENDPVLGTGILLLKVEKSEISRDETALHEEENMLNNNSSDQHNIHIEDKLFNCKICRKSFGTENDFVKHRRFMHPLLKPYCCHFCGERFSDELALSEHTSCCDRQFTKRCSYIKHLNDHDSAGELDINAVAALNNSQGKLFECPICCKFFDRIESLIIHKKYMHPGVKPYSCNFCPQSFFVQSRLIEHTSQHTKEKSFTCDYCTKTFLYKQNLIKHTETHAPNRLSFRCQACRKTFFNQSSLNNHERIHNNFCKFCDKSFSRKGNLSRHIRIHTDGKKYFCIKCDETFDNESSLMIHIRKCKYNKRS